VKKSTGIAGLDVVPNAREVLIKLYTKALNDVKIMPEHVVYRQVVEEFTSFRLEIVKRHEDVSAQETGTDGERGGVLRAAAPQQRRSLLPAASKLTSLTHSPSPSLPLTTTSLPPQIYEIEKEIACGQVEELIEMAKSELELIPLYASWKMWELSPISPMDDDFQVSSAAAGPPCSTLSPRARLSLSLALPTLTPPAAGHLRGTGVH